MSFGAREWAGLIVAALSPMLTVLGFGLTFYAEFSVMRADLAHIKGEIDKLRSSAALVIRQGSELDNLADRFRRVEAILDSKGVRRD